MPQKGPEEKDARGQQGKLGQSALGQGMDLESLWQTFIQHRHAGTVLDGQPVRNVILADTANGHTYQIVVTNGSLKVVLVT